MLGAQDFCGYYDWTFRHFRDHFGESALKDLWAYAIGIDSQRHYIQLGTREGMRGLFDAWHHTGQDEQCDWTFTLDEERNVLRWDMRKCPSKGFLIEHDLNADEDYCDHCIGWERSMLGTLGMELVRHEHNHCGQCWGEIRVKGKPYESLKLDCDIRKDPRWQAGFIDRFIDHEKAEAHPTDVLRSWLGDAMLIANPLEDPTAMTNETGIPIVAACDYVESERTRCVVLIESPPQDSTLRALANRILALPAVEQPLLLYSYLPHAIHVRFAEFGLPRPLPILPILIRAGRYAHDPGAVPPVTKVWMQLLASAIS